MGDLKWYKYYSMSLFNFFQCNNKIFIGFIFITFIINLYRQQLFLNSQFNTNTSRKNFPFALNPYQSLTKSFSLYAFRNLIWILKWGFIWNKILFCLFFLVSFISKAQHHTWFTVDAHVNVWCDIMSEK